MRIARPTSIERSVTAGVAAAVLLAVAGSAPAHGASTPTVVVPDDPASTTPVPTITPIRIGADIDDVAVRPDGTIVVATEANSAYRKRARPAATAVRFDPLGVQLPSLKLLAPSVGAETTTAAVTPTGALVAWAAAGKPAVTRVLEMADDGTAGVPQQISTPGRSGWPIDAASGGGAAGVMLVEADSKAAKSRRLRLAYRAPGGAAFSTVGVPIRSELRDFWEHRLAFGPSGDGAFIAWSNDTHAASIWRIGRDGSVGPELPVALKSRGYVDGLVAVGADGTIAATFGIFDNRKRDQVVIAQVPAGGNALAPLYRVRASEGGSLSTQHVGLAVSAAGRLLVSFDGSGSQIVVEGSGRALTTQHFPYVGGGSTETAWLADGSAVVVFEEYDSLDETSRLMAMRHAPGAGFDGRERPIGQGLTPPAKTSVPTPGTRSKSAELLGLVPAPDGSAVLSWQVFDGRRLRASVARIQP